MQIRFHLEGGCNLKWGQKINSNYEIRKGIIGVPTYSIERFRQKRNSIALVIPVINESSRIVKQIEKINLLEIDIDIIIADGGSTDGTLEYLRSMDKNLTALLTKLSPGKLSTQLRMAFNYCIDNEYECVITMDGNDKDGVSGIFEVMSALSNSFEFVQGSRFISGGHSQNTPILRYLGIRLIHAPISSFASGRRFTDTTNGFRGFSTRFLNDPEVSIFRDIFDSYELVAYLPIAAGKLGYSTVEVPVSRVYPEKGAIPTKIVGLRAQLDLLVILLKAAFGVYFPKNVNPRRS